MRIAIVGCGFVADLYLMTLPLHSGLVLTGVYDRDPDRRDATAAAHGTRAYATLDELLGDPAVEIVLNLTNPRSHYAVSLAALGAGKHVYSEKPLAMTLEEARHLFDVAAQRGLYLSGAPCTALGETAQTIGKAIRDGAAGRVRLVYAEMDEGMIPIAPYRSWLSPSGKPWPYRDEFETGCTLEHAGYCLTWLGMYFGPAQEISAFSAVLVPEKCDEVPAQASAPDYTVASIRYAGGVVARVTCGIVAPHDHRFSVIGDLGVLSTPESWSVHSPVHLRKWLRIRRRLLLSPWRSRIRLPSAQRQRVRSGGSQRIDFALGVAELADAIRDARRPRLPADFVLHITEMALAINGAAALAQPYRMQTSFAPIEPMPWAV